MKLIGASTLITCNEKWEILRDGGIVFDSGVIKDVGNFDELAQKYYNCDFVFYKNHTILPAFINSHIHFEFSKNETSFRYGNFGIWLDSVMENRGEVLKDNYSSIQQAILTQKKSGVGSVCAISSYDLDLDLLLDSKLRVIYFHEVLGAMEEDFTKQALQISNRLEKTLPLKSPTFIPSLALHSPYSVNKQIAQYVVDLAMKYNLLISTHFLESKEELEWLTNKSGYFKSFYSNNFNIHDSKPHFDIDSFLFMLKDLKTLFVHCLYADENVCDIISKQGAIISCPRSNILLNGKMGINNIIATDGKSSNIDVNILEELRYTLLNTILLDSNIDIEKISKKLLYSITSNPANALNLNNGVLSNGKFADIALFEVDLNCMDNVASSFILNAKQASRLLIAGNDIL